MDRIKPRDIQQEPRSSHFEEIAHDFVLTFLRQLSKITQEVE